MLRSLSEVLATIARRGIRLALAFAAFSIVTAAHAQDELGNLTEAGATIGRDAKSGAVRFIGFGASAPASSARDTGIQAASAESAAAQHLSRYGSLFGLTAPTDETRIMKHAVRDGGRTMTRFRQHYKGVPVIAGEMIVNQTADRKLASISGKISPNLDLDVTPGITPQQAERIALDAVAKWYSMPAQSLKATAPELSIYDSRLISPHSDPVTLVWRVEVAPIDGLRQIKEFIGINARNGLITIHFNQAPHARNRLTYDSGGVRNDTLPGTTPVCNESNPNCTGGHQDAVYAHTYAGTTYDYYHSNFGRDSIDGLGMSLISTVRFCYIDPGESCPYENAFWNDSQMVYGAGFSKGEDVVAHELTHGVTSRESNLFYYYQSGAINESLSDVFGELAQQSNPATTVTPATKWRMGEDLSIGAIRNMANPPEFNDPDRMTSPYYYLLGGDNGGVHFNSGVNNKAAYLMTDGGTFNGKTVAGLGRAKVGHIYYEVQTNLLTSGSDYLDLYYALQQACQNLVNSHEIVAADCVQVKNAIDAVEMSLQPASNFNPEAGTCPAGKFASNLFFHGFESALDKWLVSGTPDIWWVDSIFAKTGTQSADGLGYGINSYVYNIDSSIFMTNPVTLPEGAYLRFDHAFEFEEGYDGGIVEYSTDGTNWNRLTSFVDGKDFYATPISSDWGSPIGGARAFSGTSHGYVSSRFALTGISGPTRFRWRIGTDSSFESWGWFVDNVQLYSCITLPPSAPPVINSITAGGGMATIHFSAPASNTGSPVTGYTASCSAPGQTTRTQSGTTSPIVVRGLRSGVTYTCTVTANNSAGSSPASNSLAVVPRKISIAPILMMLLN